MQAGSVRRFTKILSTACEVSCRIRIRGTPVSGKSNNRSVARVPVVNCAWRLQRDFSHNRWRSAPPAKSQGGTALPSVQFARNGGKGWAACDLHGVTSSVVVSSEFQQLDRLQFWTQGCEAVLNRRLEPLLAGRLLFPPAWCLWCGVSVGLPAVKDWFRCPTARSSCTVRTLVTGRIRKAEHHVNETGEPAVRQSNPGTRLRGRPWLLTVALSTALALTGCTGSGSGPGQSQGAGKSESTAGPAATGDGSSPGGQAGNGLTGYAAIPGIIDEVQSSVVTVFNGEGLGSGVIYSGDGLILTNEHVVRGAEEIEIGFADGQRVPGTVVAADPVTDLALVEVQRDGLPAAEFETDQPEVGELAVVIGSPLGFENSASAGIISGLHREIPGSATNSQSLVNLIQTDAAISPGNSGGAVVNAEGEVIGISEAYIPPQTGAVSLGFAIPAATAVEVAEELIEDGTAENAYLGLVPRTLTPQIAGQLGLERSSGVVVLSVRPGTPAAEAGIEAGDLLVSLGGEQLQSAEDLLAALRTLNPGDTVNVELIRNGGTENIDITVAERPTDN